MLETLFIVVVDAAVCAETPDVPLNSWKTLEFNYPSRGEQSKHMLEGLFAVVVDVAELNHVSSTVYCSRWCCQAKPRKRRGLLKSLVLPR